MHTQIHKHPCLTQHIHVMQSSLNLFLSDILTGCLTDTVLNVVGLIQYHNLTLQVDLHLWQVKPPISESQATCLSHNHCQNSNNCENNYTASWITEASKDGTGWVGGGVIEGGGRLKNRIILHWALSPGLCWNRSSWCWGTCTKTT